MLISPLSKGSLKRPLGVLTYAMVVQGMTQYLALSAPGRDAEAQLLERARAWDMEALAEIYDVYSPLLYRYAARLLGDADLAEECVAETFSRFLHALKRGKGPKQHLKAYLFRIAHNWITDRYRRGKPTLALDETPLRFHGDPDQNPEEEADRLLLQARVRQALFHLTPEQRQVIVLRFLEGWSHKEIAEALGKPVSAVKALQRRGLAALKRVLEHEESGHA